MTFPLIESNERIPLNTPGRARTKRNFPLFLGHFGRLTMTRIFVQLAVQSTAAAAAADDSVMRIIMVKANLSLRTDSGET